MLKENNKKHVFVCIAPPRPCMYAPRYVSSIARLLCPSRLSFGGWAFSPPRTPCSWGVSLGLLTCVDIEAGKILCSLPDRATEAIGGVLFSV